jgi:hypothetical protein
MTKKILIIIICSLLLLECKKNNISQEHSSLPFQDTFIKVRDQDQVFFIQPTLKYIDSLKNTFKNKDDFYTIADDANYYTAEAGNLLIKNNIDTVNVKNDKILYAGEKKIILSTYKPWSLLLYKKGGIFKNIDPIDLFSSNEKIIPVFFNNNYKKNGDYKRIVSNENDITDSLKSVYKILQKKECDLNEDGLNDIVLIFQPLKPFIQTDKITLDSPVYVLMNKGKNKFQVYQNKNIIYSFIPNSPAEGFRDLIIKNNFFTIEQQEGSGWFLVDSYTTFKYDKTKREIILSKYGKSFTDRRNPEKSITDEIYTTKNFGVKNFENVTEDLLNNLTYKK